MQIKNVNPCFPIARKLIYLTTRLPAYDIFRKNGKRCAFSVLSNGCCIFSSITVMAVAQDSNLIPFAVGDIIAQYPCHCKKKDCLTVFVRQSGILFLFEFVKKAFLGRIFRRNIGFVKLLKQILLTFVEIAWNVNNNSDILVASAGGIEP